MSSVEDIVEQVRQRDPNEPEFLQAVEEILLTLKPLVEKNPKYLKVLERMVEPERMITFRVPWVDRTGKQQINRGWRVEFNSALGPFKGGLRFREDVNLSVVKFLGFEQIFKNSLTTLPLGGGKGGSDFDPKGKTDLEVMTFCQSFMTELFRHIGPNTDVPAGDIGVGGREIGFLFGQYKRLTNRFEGVLTGKGISLGGSLIRPEATGYGVVYFADHMLRSKGSTLAGARVLVSGSGNVAQFAVEKLIEEGAIVLTMSDSGGTIVEPEGITVAGLAFIQELKNERRGRICEYTSFSPTAQFLEGKKPWGAVEAEVAIPCATQNEINLDDAKALVASGVRTLVEGANMPTTNDAITFLQSENIHYGPAKAANAGGVAVSGLEMTQNSMRLTWTREEVDEKLRSIMQNIFDACTGASEELGDPGNLQLGANVAGFLKVASAMEAQGIV